MTTVVLLHGQPGTGDDWSAVVPLLEGEFTVLAPDRPGYGRAGGRAGGFTANAAAVAALLGRSGASPAVVVGHSWAGGVAIRLAASAPARVAGVVLAASIGPEPPSLTDRVLAVPPLGEVTAALALVGAGSLRRRLPPARRTALDGLRRWPGAWRSFGVEQRCYVAEASSLALDLPAVVCPVTVVAGSEDRIVPPETAERLAAALPDARLVMVPGVGHLLPHDAPAAVAAAVRDVARRSGDEPGGAASG